MPLSTIVSEAVVITLGLALAGGVRVKVLMR